MPYFFRPISILSVSTAPEATDDGMSVVALVQMLESLSKNRPRRTALFNLNNGEEDQLHERRRTPLSHFLSPSSFVHLLRWILATPVVQLDVDITQLRGCRFRRVRPCHATDVVYIYPSQCELLFAVTFSSSDRRRMISDK